MPPFTLTKWYLDCADAEGRVAIAYWSVIAWRGLSLTWHSVCLHEPGAEPVHHTSLAPVSAPSVADSEIKWATVPLNFSLNCRSRNAGFGQRLLDTAEGGVDWRCEAAGGEMTITCGDRPASRGFGYAERVEITLPPWRLPIDQLRWGRWISADGARSVVWIDWRGSKPLTAVFVDGRAQPAGVVGDGRIEIGDTALTLTDQHTLFARSLSDTLGVVRPVLAPVLPPSWLTLEDRKSRSRGILSVAGRPDESGWAIHEEVRWPS